MQDKNKNNFLDRLAGSRPLWGALAGPPKKKHYGESWRAHPKKTIMRSPGGPTQKKNKNFSSCSCTRPF